MAKSCDDLTSSVHELRTVMAERLQWAITNIKPADAGEVGGHFLADKFDDWSAEVSASLEEAEQACQRAQSAALGTLNLNALALALVDLHRAVRRSAHLFNGEISSLQTFADLRRLKVTQPPWAGWADDVAEAVKQCRAPLEHVEDSVADAWAQWAEIALVVVNQPRGQPASLKVRSTQRSGAAKRPLQKSGGGPHHA